jgi:hypothetical protein
MRAAILLLFLVVLPGCPTPTQYGGPIAVDTEGFAVRMAWLCRWGMSGANASACFQELSQQQELVLEQDGDGGAEPAPEEPAEVADDAGVEAADTGPQGLPAW